LHAADVLAKPEDVWKRLIAPRIGGTRRIAGRAALTVFTSIHRPAAVLRTVSGKGQGRQSRHQGQRRAYARPFLATRQGPWMRGSLGPLQSEAATGTLTIAMEPLKSGSGTRVSFSYVVGGYMRFKTADIGPAVDAVLREQFDRMIKPLGKVVGNETGEAPEETKKADAKAPTKADPKKAGEKTDLDAAVDAIEPEPKLGKPEQVEADDAESADQPE
jgi:hypothetical protein